MRLPTSLRRSRDTARATSTRTMARSANANANGSANATTTRHSAASSKTWPGLAKWEAMLRQAPPADNANAIPVVKCRSSDASARHVCDTATPNMQRERSRAQVQAVDSFSRNTILV